MGPVGRESADSIACSGVGGDNGTRIAEWHGAIVLLPESRSSAYPEVAISLLCSIRR
jgi:hypothetical protein